MTSLLVESVGVLALLEDRGRSGLAHLGVGRSGAADRASCDLANRLVGNHPEAACIEATLGRLRVQGRRVGAGSRDGGAGHHPLRRPRPGRQYLLSRARAGDTVTLGAPTAGLRTYVAVRGGIAGEEVLGSVSWDTMAQLGTPPLRAGDVLRVGDAAADWPATDLAPVAAMDTGSLDLPSAARPA